MVQDNVMLFVHSPDTAQVYSNIEFVQIIKSNLIRIWFWLYEHIRTKNIIRFERKKKTMFWFE